MSHRYIIYEIATGNVICTNTAVSRSQMLPEGTVEGDPSLAVKHGFCCPTTERIERGKVVPQGTMERIRRERHQGWIEVKQRRMRLLGQTDFMMVPDYPMEEDARAELKMRRQQTRDITTATNDPKEALRILGEIWENTNVE